MAQSRNLEGQRFGRALVISKAGSMDGKIFWNCVCDCGKEFKTYTYYLTGGKMKSCGCWMKEHRKNGFYRTHSLSSTSIYKLYRGIKRRCYNSHEHNYYNYGGRGINMCEEWRNDFIKFYNWALENGYEKGLQIDRIDNEKGYSPDNCKFSTAKEQANNRRSNIVIEYEGRTQTLTQWCEEFNFNYDCIRQRIAKGWDVYKALFTEVRKVNRRKRNA